MQFPGDCIRLGPANTDYTTLVFVTGLLFVSKVALNTTTVWTVSLTVFLCRRCDIQNGRLEATFKEKDRRREEKAGDMEASDGRTTTGIT